MNVTSKLMPELWPKILPKILMYVFITLWLVAVAEFFFFIMSYESKAGLTGQAPDRLPQKSEISRDTKSFNLMVFVHPKCPCSRATIEELQKLAHSAKNLKTTIFLLSPESIGASWSNTSLEQRARQIPGAKVYRDRNGNMARKFSAKTSGQVILYNPSGKLVFSGGITAARGQEGRNAGVLQILSLIENGNTRSTTNPVFGCSLLDDPDPNKDLKLICQ